MMWDCQTVMVYRTMKFGWLFWLSIDTTDGQVTKIINVVTNTFRFVWSGFFHDVFQLYTIECTPVQSSQNNKCYWSKFFLSISGPDIHWNHNRIFGFILKISNSHNHRMSINLREACIFCGKWAKRFWELNKSFCQVLFSCGSWCSRDISCVESFS